MVRVLFECQHLYYLPQFLPIIHELQKRGNYTLYGSIPCNNDRNEQRDFLRAISELDMNFLTDRSNRRRANKLNTQNFGLIFIGNVGQVKRIATRRSLVVMVYHGIGLKQSYYNDMHDRVNLRAVESAERFSALQNQGAENLVLCGFTKLDGLAMGVLPDKREFLLGRGLDPNLPTILYAPTFYPSSFNQLLPVLPELTGRYNIIIKPHSFGWYHRRYRYQGKQALKLVQNHKNILVPHSSEVDITPLYSIADYLISDWSSTLFEFLAVNKPVIQADFFSLRWKHRKFPRTIEKRLDRERADAIDFTYRLVQPDQLSGLLAKISSSDELAPIREAARDRYLYNLDGNATVRLVDAVEARLKS